MCLLTPVWGCSTAVSYPAFWICSTKAFWDSHCRQAAVRPQKHSTEFGATQVQQIPARLEHLSMLKVILTWPPFYRCEWKNHKGKWLDEVKWMFAANWCLLNWLSPKTLQDLSRTAPARTRMLRDDLDPLQPLCILKCVCLLCFKASPLSYKVFWHWHRDAQPDLILWIFLIYNLYGLLTTRIAAFLIRG